MKYLFIYFHLNSTNFIFSSLLYKHMHVYVYFLIYYHASLDPNNKSENTHIKKYIYKYIKKLPIMSFQAFPNHDYDHVLYIVISYTQIKPIGPQK